MTVYNINLGIGWASSGVEYAQAYRSKLFKKAGIDARFIFTDLILSDPLLALTRNLGLKDHEIIWPYQVFTDLPLSMPTCRLADVRPFYPPAQEKVEEGKKLLRDYQSANSFITYYFYGDSQMVEKVEVVVDGVLQRKDYYSSAKFCSEYYLVRDGRLLIGKRSFFNQEGSLAYDMVAQDQDFIYRLPEQICYNHQDFIAYFIKRLALREGDWLLLDRETGIGQAVFENKGQAKLAIMIHAQHFAAQQTDENRILWNNFYDYQLMQAEHVDVFIVATTAQAQKLTEQFESYLHMRPKILTIPVGALEELGGYKLRKTSSLVTVSRLAREKHVDWLIRASARARRQHPDLTLDIYGSGGQEAYLRRVIEEEGAQDFIRLMGHQDMSQRYDDYQIYISASQSEGFGLSLMEAVGAGLAMIGFDVPYGNQTFIEDGVNGRLLAWQENQVLDRLLEDYSRAILELLDSDLDAMHQASLDLAQNYLEDQVAQAWLDLIEGGNR